MYIKKWANVHDTNTNLWFKNRLIQTIREKTDDVSVQETRQWNQQKMHLHQGFFRASSAAYLA